MQPVRLLGVFPVGPENFFCALLYWQERGRFLPVWLPRREGSRLLSRLNGWNPTRPDTHDAMADVINQSTQGVSSIELSSYHEGVFVASLTMVDGAEIDLRVSDALMMALTLDMIVEVDESTLNQASIWMSAHDALLYFDLEMPTSHIGGFERGERTSADEQADSDFKELMRSLGVDEASLDVNDRDADFGEASDEDDAPNDNGED